MKTVKLLFALAVLTSLVLASCTPAATQAPPPPTVEKPAPTQPEKPAQSPSKGVMDILNSEEVTAAANDMDYSREVDAFATQDVDTSKYKKDGPYVIAASNTTMGNGWGGTYNITIDAYAEQLVKEGVLAQPLIKAVTNDANQQLNDLEDFLAKGVDAIVILPLGRAATTTLIARADAQGIPVVLCKDGVEGDAFAARVDYDFTEIAYKTGVGLAELLGGKGKIVMFNGIAGVDSTENWKAGALAAFKKYPGIEIIGEEYASWSIADSKQKMEALMAANPQVDGVWAGGGEMALGAALAFEDAGKPAPKFGMVGVPNGFLRLAKQYDYQYVGAPEPPSAARYCLQTAIDILQGKPGIKKFIPIANFMDGMAMYDFTSNEQWYVPELNDDFIPPATVDIKYYIDGGFARK